MLFSVFDWETTGLPFHPDAELSKQPRAIEFGGIITDGHDILGELEFICNPGISIEPIITEITGLTNEDLADKPPFTHFIPQLATYFGNTRGRIAHNLSFDKGILTFDLQRNGRSLADINWGGANGDAIEICTVEQTFHMYGKRVRLQDWYEMKCGPYVQKHRALDDVRLLHEACQKEGVYEAFKESVV
jgi:DNA polymerase III epsilon subunit-like protein